MMRSRWEALGGFLLAALLFSPAWGSVTPQPGTLNYIEGQAAIGSQTLSETSVGTAKLATGQSLSTADGRAEILLTPGIFVRIDDNSSLRMISPGLADTILTLEKGRAMIDVAEIRPENNVRINVNGATAQLLKAGLYEFDANFGLIRVFDGRAVVESAGKHTEVNGGHEIVLQAGGKLKDQPFNRKASSTDDFYRWAGLRSAYLAEANVNGARAYAGEPGRYSGSWYGEGWYWNPWYSAYTFIPGDGIFFDPFGWGFYSPWFAPYIGFGYGYGGLPYYRNFRPTYLPASYVANARSSASGSVGHAYSVRGAAAAAMSRGGGFSGGGGVVRGGEGFAGGGVHAAAGFSGGGGGGFHGGGGGGHGGR
jgi:hypothetical protein